MFSSLEKGNQLLSFAKPNSKIKEVVHIVFLFLMSLLGLHALEEECFLQDKVSE